MMSVCILPGIFILSILTKTVEIPIKTNARIKVVHT